MRIKSNRKQSANRGVRKKALALLRSAKFFRKLLNALWRHGLVGEQINALVLFIVATSRLLESPLCLFVKGVSGIGKNFLVDTVLAFIPMSEVHTISSSSLRSWNYMRGGLANKVVYVKERNEAAGSVHPARLLISEKQLIHSVIVKQRGRFVQKTFVTKGPIAAVSTTTKDRVEVDDETRHISIWLDDTQEQTRRINEAAVGGQNKLGQREIAIWHEVQRLLKTRARVPIEFPKWFVGVAGVVSQESLASRRYFQAFLQACRTVALIRSFRRSDSRLKAKRIITVGFIDLAITSLVFNRAFTQSIDKADDEDLEVQQVVRAISKEKGGAQVRAVDLRDHMNVSLGRAYAMLRKAVATGVIRRANEPTKANLKMYLPAESHSFLPKPKPLFRSLKGAPKTVRFVHPITGKCVRYDR